MQIMRRAGWDPHGMIQFMQILTDKEQRRPSDVQVFLSTHPAPAERVQELQGLVGSGSGRTTSARFTTVQRRLDALPPAHALPQQQE
jgi:predicted Zn-dependent protease